MIRFGVVGTGWRTKFFVRIAEACPDQFMLVGVVTRDIERAQQWMQPYNVPLFTSIRDLLKQNPLFVVSSVPWGVNPTVIKELANNNMPVLSETPPATTVEEMEALYQLVKNGAKIAVAEQYHLQPHHVARIATAHSGKLGEITQARIAYAHGYHGISLIRRYLGIDYPNVTITARKFISPIVKGPDREGLPDAEIISDSEQTIAWMDFGDKLGIFDFTGDQYRSFIRKQHVQIRGVRGEMTNDEVTYLEDYRKPITLQFQRHETGKEANLRGQYLIGIQLGNEWVYENPLQPARLMDDEIAMGDCMLRMVDYIDGGDAFYPLAEACQDRYLDILLKQAVETGQAITSETQLWAK